jgi:hypothetical protein
MIGDPPTRQRCVACGQPRPHIAIKHADPFCSTDCCKRWHGVQTIVLHQGRRT